MRVLATRTVGDPPAWIKALVRGARRHGGAVWRQTSGEVRASRADNERVDFFPVQWESKTRLCWVRMIDTGLPIIAAPSQFSNRHAAHHDNRRALPQCLRLTYLNVIRPFHHLVIRTAWHTLHEQQG